MSSNPKTTSPFWDGFWVGAYRGTVVGLPFLVAYLFVAKPLRHD